MTKVWNLLNEKQKWLVCGYITLWFLVISNPFTYSITNTLLKPLAKLMNVDANNVTYNPFNLICR